jgi:hypothetical protein
MKKHLYYLAVIYLLFLVTGCKKDETPPVVVPPDKDPVISATATTLNPDYKGACTVSWEVTGIYQTFVVSLNGSQISTEAKSSVKLDYIVDTKNFAFVCTTKSGKQVTKNLSITPKAPPLPVLPSINSFTVDHSTVESGLPVIVSWNISHAQLVSLTIRPVGKPETVNDGLDSISTLNYLPRENTLFILKASNQNGEVSDTVMVEVTLPPPLPTRSDSLTFAWLEMDMLALRQNPTIWESIIVDCEKDNHWEFNTNARFHLHEGINWCGNYEIALDCSWELLSNNTQINIGGEVYTIEELTDTTLVVTVPMTEGSSTIYKFLLQKGATSKK